MDVSDEQWRKWSPAAQERALAALQEIQEQSWKPFYCKRAGCDGLPHDNWGWKHARSDQHPPKGDWLTWLIRGGRGSGKTRTGAEWVQRRTKVSPRVALIAPTGPDGRDTLVEGESGILATSPPGLRPEWEPSKKKLTWPNGAIGHLFSGEEPDRLRGPQHYEAWVDEPAHMPLIEDVWSNLLFGLRLGQHPHICATTTPVPSVWMKNLVKDPKTISVVASTYANIHNLAPTFADMILQRFEGTRRGRQEIHGEILEDVEGALWTNDLIEDHRIKPEEARSSYDRIVVAVDPAGTSNNRSDETGIIVNAAAGDEFFVLDDKSGRYSPNGWAERAIAAYEQWDADYIVAENNYGGEMVRSTLEAAGHHVRVVTVNSRRGKIIRADPVVALYERGKVHHVGLHAELEDQLTSWVPGNNSPDRLDALVHGFTDLAKTVAPASVATPQQYGQRYAS